MSNNYKAKWLKALSDAKSETILKTEDQLKKKVEELGTGSVNATLLIKQLQKPMIEVASEARQILETMDNFTKFETLEFSECTTQLEGKLSQMNLKVIARRSRDVLKIAHARIGILSVALQEAEERLKSLGVSLDSAKTLAQNMETALLETYVIGQRPTRAEMDDLNFDIAQDGLDRFGLTYDDMDEQDVLATLKAAQHAKDLRSIRSELDAESDDDESDEDGGTNAVQSVVLSHKRGDSAISLSNGHRTLADELNI